MKQSKKCTNGEKPQNIKSSGVHLPLLSFSVIFSNSMPLKSHGRLPGWFSGRKTKKATKGGIPVRWGCAQTFVALLVFYVLFFTGHASGLCAPEQELQLFVRFMSDGS